MIKKKDETQSIKVIVPEVVYEPSQGWIPFRLNELWAYHELLYFLTWRDIKVRYKQAVLGVSWAIIQPFIAMVIFSVIFGKLAKLPSEGIPYAVFSYTALLPWQLFASALERSGTSLVGNANIMTKVYFPRLIIPLSAVGASLVDFCLSFIVLIGLMLYYHIKVSWTIITLPLLILLALLTALAVGIWLSALNVQYRDVQHMIPFIIQAWLYASPVAYSSSLIPRGVWQFIYGLNPLAGVIQGFRWSLLSTEPPNALFVVSIIIDILLFVSGIFYFKRVEKSFADVV